MTEAEQFIQYLYRRLNASGSGSSFGDTLHVMYDDNMSIGDKMAEIIHAANTDRYTALYVIGGKYEAASVESKETAEKILDSIHSRKGRSLGIMSGGMLNLYSKYGVNPDNIDSLRKEIVDAFKLEGLDVVAVI